MHGGYRGAYVRVFEYLQCRVHRQLHSFVCYVIVMFCTCSVLWHLNRCVFVGELAVCSNICAVSSVGALYMCRASKIPK